MIRVKHKRCVGLAAALLIAAATQANADYVSTVLADNPVGYWKLDNSGSTLVNSGSAGATLNGTYTNFVPANQQVTGLIAGSSDTAAKLDASLASQTVHVSSAPDIGGTGLNSVA